MAFPRLLAALDFAAERHSAQRRKGADAAPYVNHLIEVATLLSTVAGVNDVEILMAAVLHDVIEDTPTTAKEVSERFGARVCQLVEALSDDKSLPRAQRREVVLQALPSYGADVKVIKLADLTSNIKHLPSSWSDARKWEYQEWSERAATICSEASEPLAKLYWERARLSRSRLPQRAAE